MQRTRVMEWRQGMNAQHIDKSGFYGRRTAELPGAMVDILVRLESPDDVVTARQQGRAFSIALGFSSGDATIVATLMSELARQVVRERRRGDIVLMAAHGSRSLGVIIATCREERSAPDAASHLTQCGRPAEMLVGEPELGELWVASDELELSRDGLNGLTLTVTKWKV